MGLGGAVPRQHTAPRCPVAFGHESASLAPLAGSRASCVAGSLRTCLSPGHVGAPCPARSVTEPVPHGDTGDPGAAGARGRRQRPGFMWTAPGEEAAAAPAASAQPRSHRRPPEGALSLCPRAARLQRPRQRTDQSLGKGRWRGEQSLVRTACARRAGPRSKDGLTALQKAALRKLRAPRPGPACVPGTTGPPEPHRCCRAVPSFRRDVRPEGPRGWGGTGAASPRCRLPPGYGDGDGDRPAACAQLRPCSAGSEAGGWGQDVALAGPASNPGVRAVAAEPGRAREGA